MTEIVTPYVFSRLMTLFREEHMPFTAAQIEGLVGALAEALRMARNAMDVLGYTADIEKRQSALASYFRAAEPVAAWLEEA